MGRRRANGQGSVFQRRDGRWEAAAYVLHADGSSRRVSRYAATRAQAEEKLAQLLASNAELVPVNVDRTTTVGAYLTWWLDAVAVHRLRPTTLVTYRQYTRRYLIPGLGRHRLVALSTGQVQQWLTSLRQVCWCCNQNVDARRPAQRRRCCALGSCCGSLLTAGTIAYLRAILSSALAHAVREDKLLRNVASPVRLPAPGRSPDSPLTADEARRLLTAARGHRLWALFELAIGCGLRRGELLGLRWTDIDLDQATMTVEQSVQRRRDTGALITLPTKSAASQRTVPIPGAAVTALREHHRRQDRERDQMGSRWRNSGLVFTNTIGTALDPGMVNRALDEISQDAEVRKVRVHTLRHSCATLLLEQNVDLLTISHVLGHARLGITADVYTSVRMQLQRAAIDALGQALRGGEDPDDGVLAHAA